MFLAPSSQELVVSRVIEAPPPTVYHLSSAQLSSITSLITHLLGKGLSPEQASKAVVQTSVYRDNLCVCVRARFYCIVYTIQKIVTF